MTNAEQWQRSGFEALERGVHVAALAAAEELRALRNTAAFEIGALAHLRAGRADEALQMLEEGVEHGPDVWLLWQLLGNDRSDFCHGWGFKEEISHFYFNGESFSES
ncbi:MAG: tetratricopeptide repeat protein [Planctomycetota bacterium]